MEALRRLGIHTHSAVQSPPWIATPPLPAPIRKRFRKRAHPSTADGAIGRAATREKIRYIQYHQCFNSGFSARCRQETAHSFIARPARRASKFLIISFVLFALFACILQMTLFFCTLILILFFIQDNCSPLCEPLCPVLRLSTLNWKSYSQHCQL